MTCPNSIRYNIKQLRIQSMGNAYVLHFNNEKPLLFACPIVLSVWNERLTATTTNQTFHFIFTSISVMINLLMFTSKASDK